jgi:hypothetical protein
VPSAFTHTTGQAHWELLLRARAVENLAYVLAPAQGGVHENGRHTWGHSMVVDPWGSVLAQHGPGPGVVLAELDAAAAARRCAQLPALDPPRAVMMPTHHRTPLAALAQRMAAVVAVDRLAGGPGGVHAGHPGVAGRALRSQPGAKRLERDAADAGSDIRSGADAQPAEPAGTAGGRPGLLAWEVEAAELLRQRRELVRIEWRDVNACACAPCAQTPYRPVSWDNAGRARNAIPMRPRPAPTRAA